MARPTKLTAEVQKRIVQGIQLGATYELAAQYGGVHYDTFNNWMKRGAADVQARTDTSHSRFYITVKSETDKARPSSVAMIRERNNRKGEQKSKFHSVQRCVYFIRESFQGLIKIGVAKNLESRFAALQSSCPQELEIVGYVETQKAVTVERAVHERFMEKHHRGEWFELTDKELSLALDFCNANVAVDLKQLPLHLGKF